MKAKYIGNIALGVDIRFIDINSYKGENFEQKLSLAEIQVSKNKSLKLFDENKEMIGDLELDEKSAGHFIQQKIDALAIKENELNEREAKLNELEANKKEVLETKEDTIELEVKQKRAYNSKK